MHLLSFLQALLLAGALSGLLFHSAIAQNCGCSSDLCCSQYGYCGSSYAYCGPGCQEGPCYGADGSSGGGSIGDVVTQAFFDRIASQAGARCAGKGFYTRDAFLSVASAYPQFGTTGADDVKKREIAAYFAHVTHETGHFCNIEEIKTFLRFWMTNKVHDAITSGQGFGATARLINDKVKPDNKNQEPMNARVGYYKDYCKQLGVAP